MAYDNPVDSSSVEDAGNSSAGKTINFWLKWIRASKKAANRHWGDSRAAWREYENRTDLSSSSTAEADGRKESNMTPLCYPAYWTCSKIIEPSYYSMTPNPMIEVDFGWEDIVAETASIMAERVGNHFLRNSDFDTSMSAGVQDFIHADKATIQVIPNIKEDGGRAPLSQNEDGSYSNEAGEVHTGKVMTDGTNYFSPAPSCTGIDSAPVCFDEVLHTPEAKTWREVREVAFYFCLSEDEAKKKFPDVPEASYKMGLPEDERENDKQNEPVGRYLDGWECWDRCGKSGDPVVYFVSESFPTGFLKPPAPDPYGLPGVFPCTPFIIGSKPSKSLYPTPVYIQILPSLKQLHTCYAKVFNLIPAIRRRLIVDGASEDLINALNDLSDNEFVASGELNDIVAKGGLDKMVYSVPVAEFVAAIGELNEAMDTFKANTYEWFGAPDIVRGVSDPIETLGTNEMKRDAASDRFRYAKKQVAQMARDALRMGIDMCINLYDDQKIASICGYQFMSPAQQQAFPQALQVLRDQEQRLVRVDIETDSIAFIDQRMRQQQRSVVTQTILSGMQQVNQMAQVDIGTAILALKILLATLDGMEGGKYFIDEVKQAGQQLIAKLQKEQNAPAKPDPDAEKLKIEERKQTLAEGTQKWKEANAADELSLKDAIEGAKNNIATQNTEISGLKVQNAAQQAQTAQALAESKEQFKQVADTLLLKLEGIKTASDVASKQTAADQNAKGQDIETLKTLLTHHAGMVKQAADQHNAAVGQIHSKVDLLHNHISTLQQQMKGLNSPNEGAT